MSDGTNAGAAAGTTGAAAGTPDPAAAGGAAAGGAADGTAKVADGTVKPADGAAAGAAGSALPDWRAGLEGEHKEFAARYASLQDVVQAGLDFRKANSSMVRVPGENATAEDKAKFAKAIGVPEKAEDYEFDLGREATDADKAVQASVAKIALEAGVPKGALKALSKAVTELAVAQESERNRIAVTRRDEAAAALKKEWGADAEANAELATRAYTAFGGAELGELMNTVVNGAKLGDHPVMVKAFATIGRRMGEGEFIGTVGTSQRDSVQSQINAILAANPPGTEGYKAKAAELGKLYEQLHGSGQSQGGFGRL